MCRKAYLTGIFHSDNLRVSKQPVLFSKSTRENTGFSLCRLPTLDLDLQVIHNEVANQGSSSCEAREYGQISASLESKPPSFSHELNQSDASRILDLSCPLCGKPLKLSVQECEYKAVCIDDTIQHSSSLEVRTSGNSHSACPYHKYTTQYHTKTSFLKPKDLVGIPWRVAFALQADGWYLRSDIIWHKPNPMPESVTDRPTKSHEYIFLISKSERYYYDAEAIREPAKIRFDDRPFGKCGGNRHGDEGRIFKTVKTPSGWQTGPGSHDVIEHNSGSMEERRQRSGAKWLNTEEQSSGRRMIENTARARVSGGEHDFFFGSKRNKRSVWTVPTFPFPEAHFACVDEDTECLTIDGWRKYDKINIGKPAAQYDMETGIISWAPVEEIVSYEVKNEAMVLAKNRNVAMLLTPNHRTIVAKRHNKTRKHKPLQIIRADQLRPSHSIPISSQWSLGGEHPFSADWAELIGWYIAEGCETKCSWTVEIYQSASANPDKTRRIESLLKAVGAEYSVAASIRMWRDIQQTCYAFQVRGFGATMFRQWAPKKSFHPSTLTWHDDLLSRLLDGLIDGDGHRRKDGRCSFIQRDESAADMAHAIGVRLGYSAMKSLRTGKTFVVYLTRKRLLSFRGTAGYGAKIEQIPYSGIIWCPKLPKGTWVARKGGRAFITGNTFPPNLIKPCILAGCPTGGVVMDPFAGSGTTLFVSKELGRKSIAIEIKEEYCRMILKRTQQEVLPL